jgi:hypothetical protein
MLTKQARNYQDALKAERAEARERAVAGREKVVADRENALAERERQNVAGSGYQFDTRYVPSIPGNYDTRHAPSAHDNNGVTTAPQAPTVPHNFRGGNSNHIERTAPLSDHDQRRENRMYGEPNANAPDDVEEFHRGTEPGVWFKSWTPHRKYVMVNERKKDRRRLHHV